MHNNNSSLLGILFMLINTLSLAFLDITAKHLKTSMNAAHIVFLYKFTLFLVILPWVFQQGLKNIKSEKLYTHLVRSFFSVMGSLCFFKGLQHVNMADAAALENIQYVLLVLVGMMFFNEKVTKTKICTVIIGFLGAVIVVKPHLVEIGNPNNIISLLMGEGSAEGTFEINRYFGLILLAIGFWSMNSVSVKILGKTEKNRTQMFYLMLFATLWSAPFAFIEWGIVDFGAVQLAVKPISYYSILDFNMNFYKMKYIFFMAACYFIHGIAYFNSLKSDISIVAPFRYTKLIFSALLGYIFFGEVVENSSSFIGYVLILTSGLMLTRYELRRMTMEKRLGKKLGKSPKSDSKSKIQNKTQGKIQNKAKSSAIRV